MSLLPRRALEPYMEEMGYAAHEPVSLQLSRSVADEDLYMVLWFIPIPDPENCERVG